MIFVELLSQIIRIIHQINKINTFIQVKKETITRWNQIRKKNKDQPVIIRYNQCKVVQNLVRRSINCLTNISRWCNNKIIIVVYKRGDWCYIPVDMNVMAEFECSNSRILTAIEVFHTLEGVCAHANQANSLSLSTYIYACICVYAAHYRMHTAKHTLETWNGFFPHAQRRKN